MVQCSVMVLLTHYHEQINSAAEENIDVMCEQAFFCYIHLTVSRVATAQGKQGIWFLLFPDRENTGNFIVTQGKFLRHRENIFDCIY